jgi:nitrate reductase gamma subunit
MSDIMQFVVLPYVAMVLLVGVSIYRYRNQGFSVSALSSQSLENRMHFWGLVPFHWGILFVLTGHLLALTIPSSILWWNGVPVRLFALEITGLAAALLALFGLAVIMLRRFQSRTRVVLSKADVLLYLILVVQIVTGIWVAVTMGWGTTWFTSTATPYIWSLLILQPEIDRITPLPVLVQTHIVTAWLFILVAPFTRMVHAMVAPFPYLWRKPQMVRWWRKAPR